MKVLQNKKNWSLSLLFNLTVLPVLFGILFMLFLTIGGEYVEGQTEAIPPENELKQMVNATMLDFALAIKARDFTSFYNNIAKHWQEQTTKEELLDAFKSFVDQNVDLTGIQKLDLVFTEPSQITNEGLLVLEGHYPTQPSVTYFTLKYFYEDPEWKLFGISVNLEEDSIPGAQPGVIPPAEQLEQLVNTTMLDFAVAVKARDFSGFYTKIAKLWQAQTTPEELTTIFQSFSDQNIDLTVLQGLKPVFIAQPFLNDNGWLVLQGYYPTQPSITYFTLEYLYEEPEWKLGVIDVNVTKDPPPNSYLMPMVNTTMLDFALAVNARDFTDFYQNVAKLWQDQTTPEELANIFQSFSDQNIDLTVLQGLEPAFTKEPFLDDNGWLALEGQYPTQPSTVYFALKYLFEDPEWKLVGININVE